MQLFDREALKKLFKKGSTPTQSHFSSLIDSTINKIDDGFGKSIRDGLQLHPLSPSKKLLSFYKDIREKHPDWGISIDPREQLHGLSFEETTPEGENIERLFLKKGGNVGIGTVQPRGRLDVNGTVVSKNRMGGYRIGKVPANGEWHSIVNGLTGCHAFEIVAKALGRQKSGIYAMAHATAVNANGASNAKVRITQSFRGGDFYDRFRYRIKFRWRGTPKNYSLEMKTGNYGTDNGKDLYIFFHVCQLWNDG